MALNKKEHVDKSDAQWVWQQAAAEPSTPKPSCKPAQPHKIQYGMSLNLHRAWAAYSPVGEVLALHFFSVVWRPGGVAPYSWAPNGQHAQPGAPRSEQLHPHVPRHQAVGQEGANQAQLCCIPGLTCMQALCSGCASPTGMEMGTPKLTQAIQCPLDFPTMHGSFPVTPLFLPPWRRVCLLCRMLMHHRICNKTGVCVHLTAGKSWILRRPEQAQQC